MSLEAFTLHGVELMGSSTAYAVDLQVQHEGFLIQASCTVIEYYDANGDHYTWEISHVDPEQLEKPVREIEAKIVEHVQTAQDDGGAVGIQERWRGALRDLDSLLRRLRYAAALGAAQDAAAKADGKEGTDEYPGECPGS